MEISSIANEFYEQKIHTTNYSVESFTDEEIIATDCNYASYGYDRYRTDNGKIIKGYHSCSQFSGIYTLEDFNDCQSNAFSFSSKVQSGNFEIAIVYN